MHRRFLEFSGHSSRRDLSFHFVTNGNSYPSIRRALAPFRKTLTDFSFGLDGATAPVHDAVRGRDGAAGFSWPLPWPCATGGL